MNSAGFLSHSHHPAAPSRCKRQSLIISKRICDFVCRRSAENNLYRSESFRFLQKTNHQFPPDPRKSPPRQNEIEINDNYVEPLDQQEKGKCENGDPSYFEIEERYNAPYYYSDTIKEPAYCSPHPTEEYGNIIPPPLGYGLLPPDSRRKNEHGPPVRSATRNSIRSQSSVDTGAGSSSLHSKSSSSEDPLDHTFHGENKRNNFVSVCHIHHSPASTITSSSSSSRPPDPYHFSTRIIPSSSSPPPIPHFLLSSLSCKPSSRQNSLAKSKALLSRSVNCLNSLNLALNLHEEEEKDEQQDHSSLDHLHSRDYPKYAYRWSNIPQDHYLPPSPSLTPSPVHHQELLPPAAKHFTSPSSSSPVSSYRSSYLKNTRNSKIHNSRPLPTHHLPPSPPAEHPPQDKDTMSVASTPSPAPRVLKRDRLGSNSHYPLARRSLHIIDDALLHSQPHSPPPDQLNQVKSSDPLFNPLPLCVNPPSLQQDPIQMSTSSPGPMPIYPNDSSTASLASLPNLNGTYVQPEKMPSKTRHSKYSLPPGNLIHNSSLEMQDWFHGLMTRRESEHLLRSTKIGSFLVRNCENAAKDLYSLSIKSPKGIIHIRLEPNSRGYYAMADQEFPCVPSLIEHFMEAKLPLKGTDHLQLMFPVITHLL